MNTREISFNILKNIETGDLYVSDVLSKALRQLQFKDKRDRAFITRLVEGVTERRLTLDFLIDKLSQKKGSASGVRPDVRILLRMGIYQIRYMEGVPARAAISETVKLVKEKGYGGLSGYVNVLLRKVATLYQEGKLDSYIVSNPVARYSTPVWLLELLTENYGKEQTRLILEDQFRGHDTVIRVNELRTDLDTLRSMLIDSGVTIKEAVLSKGTSLRISGYDMISRLPGYREGFFVVQDETSTYAVSRAGIRPGDRVLDLCASPGGKSLYAYQLTSRDGRAGLVVSRDISEEKLLKIKENADRLKIPVTYKGSSGSDGNSISMGICLEISDATEPDRAIIEADTDSKFDVVIADVPCSGLGIIGRKNDIKYHMSMEAATELSQQGLTILKNASRYIKKNGRILYSTCTINPGENQEVVRRFLESEEGAAMTLLEERTFLQGIDGSDGFYYAILT